MARSTESWSEMEEVSVRSGAIGSTGGSAYASKVVASDFGYRGWSGIGIASMVSSTGSWSEMEKVSVRSGEIGSTGEFAYASKVIASDFRYRGSSSIRIPQRHLLPGQGLIGGRFQVGRLR